MTKYTYLALLPDVTADGRPLAFGDEVSLSSEETKANSRLIDSGSLVEKPAAPKPKASPKANPSTKEGK